MSKLIIFKTISFPTFSETFIVSNITKAIDAGYTVKIIVDQINYKGNSSQPHILAKYGLLDKVFKFEQPKGNIKRKIKAMYLLLNPLMLYYFIKYSLFKGKRTLDYVFILNFYWKDRKAKAIHVHFATAIHPLFELKEIGFLKSKIIVTFHGYDEHGLPEGELLKNLLYKFNKYVDHITVNTEYLKSKLLDKGFPSNRIIIIPMGIDTDFFHHSEKRQLPLNKNIKLLSVGRLVAIKGFNYALLAIKQIIDNGYGVEYTIAGAGQEEANLKRLINELELNTHVVMVGSQNQNEVRLLMQNNDIFIMSSVADDTGRREAQGVVTAEAQAMGLPVVAFKSGGVPYTIKDGETGTLVEEKNVNAFAQSIIEIINAPERYKQMSEAARVYAVNEFSNVVMGSRFQMLYG